MTLRQISFAAALLLSTSAYAADPKAKADAASNPVVAKVNGVELHRSDVLQAQATLPQQYQQMPLDQLYPQLLSQVVTSELVVEAGKKAKLQDDPEVKKEMARVQDEVVRQVWIKRVIDKAVTDKGLHEQYDKYVATHPAKEQVHASHVLVDSEEEAKAIIAELDKGADFATLAKQRSKDPGKDNGGDLGFFSKEDMVPEFADAAFKLKNGEYTKTPVKSQFGWHVIKVADHRTAQPSFDEAKPGLQRSMAQEAFRTKITELRDAAKIETFALDGSPLPAAGPAPAAAPANTPPAGAQTTAPAPAPATTPAK